MRAIDYFDKMWNVVPTARQLCRRRPFLVCETFGWSERMHGRCGQKDCELKSALRSTPKHPAVLSACWHPVGQSGLGSN